MPLPFLKPKQGGVASLIIKNRNPDKLEENQEDRENHGQKLIDAINSGDAKAVEDCVKVLFKSFEKQPHEEIEHKDSPHTYENQNMKAGEQE